MEEIVKEKSFLLKRKKKIL